MFERKWLVIAGEEAGPKSNKMGGIWNVIDAPILLTSDSFPLLSLTIFFQHNWFPLDNCPKFNWSLQ
jgi:hypothetical protein